MRCKTLTAAAAVLLMLTAGCSTLERVVYRPDINQGNYLAPNDISKIRIGMTQQQVAYALGTPMMSDPFGTNTWFYVFRQQPGHEKSDAANADAHLQQQRCADQHRQQTCTDRRVKSRQ